jgi:hypothetical protein
MMARDNPQGASAMAQVPAMEARAWQPRYSNVNFNPVNGQTVSFDQRTGQYNMGSMNGQGGQGNGSGFQPFVKMPEKAADEINERDEQIQVAQNNLQHIEEIRRQLTNGELNPQVWNRVKGFIDNTAGVSDPNDQKIANSLHWLKFYEDAMLKSHPGTQTDADRHAVEATVTPSGSEYDPAQLAQSIENLISNERQHLTSSIRAQKGAYNLYRGQIPRQDPNGDLQRYDTLEKQLDANDAAWNKAKGPWLKGLQNASNAAAAPAAATPKYSGASGIGPAPASQAPNNPKTSGAGMGSHSQTMGSGSHNLDLTHGDPITPKEAAMLPPGTLFRDQYGRILRTH